MNEFSERLRVSCVQHAARVAVLERGRAVTYAKLERRVAAGVATLSDAGAGPGALVAVGGARTAARVADLLAVWRVGASALLLCPRWPTAYREGCVERSGAAWMLSDGALKSAGFARTTQSHPPELAYVVFSSGSGGRPKGVLVSHAGLVPMLDAQIAAFGLSPDSRSLFMLGLGFDASLSDMGTALLAGATLVLEDDAACAPGRIAETLARRAVTYVDIPPAYLSELDERSLPRTLKTIVVGGEVPPAPAVARLSPHVALFNVYGPSEATVCTSIARCGPSWTRALLGQPIGGNRYRLRRESNADVGVAEGELLIEGPGVALGYLDDEALTRERFTTGADGPRQRVFRTGDRVRATADGDWEFLGRVDRQLKRRGQLVAPEEVEAALHATGLVRAASVRLAPESGQLVACVESVPAEPALGELELVRRVDELLRIALPPALVPDRIEVVASLARGHNGKVAHRAPARPVTPCPPTSPGMLAQPTHDIETGTDTDTGTLAFVGALMGASLGRGPLDADADFYAMGGDSLRALDVCACAEAAGWGLVPRDVVHGRSPRGVLTRSSTQAPQAFARTELDRWVGERVPLPRSSGRPSTLRGAHVLVTGASGSLGAALLEPLLAAVGAEGHVHCLVRRPDALSRAPDLRVTAHLGDVTEVRLGLAQELYARLADEVSVVLHLAAQLGAASLSTLLTQVNVEGTRQVLSFVAAGRPKALLHASTLSVLADAQPRATHCTEDDAPDATERVMTPYAASKWSAERLVRASDADAGAATVVRLGLLTGATPTGAGASSGHLARVIRGLAALGALPQLDGDAAAALRFDVTPLDHAANACVDLLSHDLRRGHAGIYHVAAAQAATLPELAAALLAEGVPLASCSWPELCGRAGRLRDPSGDAALAVLSLCRADPLAFARHRALDLFAASGTHFSLVNTQRALSGTPYVAPMPTVALLRLYVRSALA